MAAAADALPAENAAGTSVWCVTKNTQTPQLRWDIESHRSIELFASQTEACKRAFDLAVDSADHALVVCWFQAQRKSVQDALIDHVRECIEAEGVRIRPEINKVLKAQSNPLLQRWSRTLKKGGSGPAVRKAIVEWRQRSKEKYDDDISQNTLQTTVFGPDPYDSTDGFSVQIKVQCLPLST